jgi:hypothetical protein
MKGCSKCKVEKENEEFGISSKTKDGFNSWCKPCVRERSKQWYKIHFETSKKKSSKRVQARREWFNQMKQSLECIKCGENHISCLDFHHIDPTKKGFGIANSINDVSFSKEQILEEIEKCAILCSNCHKKFHYMEKTEKYNLEDFLK